MYKQRFRKMLALLVTTCMAFSVTDINVYAQGDTKIVSEDNTEEVPISSLSIEAVTGAAIYYVGGEAALDSNDGTTEETSFATLSRAMQIINAIGSGQYEVKVLGNITETKEITIGTDTTAVNVTMIGASTGSAIVMRGISYTGKMINVKANSSLSLGDASNAADDNKLVFDGNYKANISNPESEIHVSSAESIVHNSGSLFLYNGVTLQNNSGGYYTYNRGSGVFNNKGSVSMTGGTICYNISPSDGGGIYNSNGTIIVTDGFIHNNSSTYAGGGIYNNGGLYISGSTVIASNTSRIGGGIDNSKTVTMMSGSVRENTATSSGGGINNRGTFIMNGGDVTANHVINANPEKLTSGGGINNLHTIKIAGGSISGNTALRGGAIYSPFAFEISGSTSIPGGEGNVNNIYLLDKIILSDGWYGEGVITLTMLSYVDNLKIIEDQTANNIVLNDKFKLIDAPNGYYIKNDGLLAFDQEANTALDCYVNSNTGNDITGDGTALKPFETLYKAVEAIEATSDKKGNIYLQSDIVLTRTLFMYGDITILIDTERYDGTNCEITRCPSFPGTTEAEMIDLEDYSVYDLKAMICNLGTLSLGNRINIDESHPDISFLGDNQDGEFIFNNGMLLMYPNVEMKNNNMRSAIFNGKVFHMFGGRIVNTSIGVKNTCVFKMEGNSTITNNQNTGVINYGYFELTSGYIINNSGMIIGGVENANIFKMSGGEISFNRGSNSGGIYNNNKYNNKSIECILSGGLITGNTSTRGFGNGITSQNGKLILSGNILIPESDDICLEVNSDDMEHNSIRIDGALTGENTVFKVSRRNSVNDTYSNKLILGDHLLSSGSDYHLTQEDISKFSFHTAYLPSNLVYTTNLQGNIAVNISGASVDITPSDIYYDGTAKQVEAIKVTYDSVDLVQGVDYLVTYENNINVAENARVIVTGIGIYGGTQKFYFTIRPVEVLKINTESPSAMTKSASAALTQEDLIHSIGNKTVEVETTNGTLIAPFKWILTEGEHNPKGGTYTYTGLIEDNQNFIPSNATLTTTIIVTPSTPLVPTFRDISVWRGTDTASTAEELGEGILPTSGMLTFGDIPLNYTITWGNKTLNTTDLSASTTFIGTIVYTNLPNWATLPENLSVSRTVEVKEIIPDITPIPNSSQVPTPTTVPTPTPFLETLIINGVETQLQIDISQDEEGGIDANFGLPMEQLLQLAAQQGEGEQLQLNIPITSQNLLNLIDDETVTSVNLSVSIPSSLIANGQIDMSNIDLDPALLQSAKDAGKDITITVKDENGKVQYSWTFAAENLASSQGDMNNINLSLTVEQVIQNTELNELLNQNSENNGTTVENSRGLVVNFEHHGDLPAQARVKIYIGNQEVIEPGDKIYLYYFNPETDKLETLPYSSSYEVDEEGYIIIELMHCSAYVILPKSASNNIVTSIKDQILVTPVKKTLYLGGSIDSKVTIRIELPNTMEVVDNFDEKTSGSAVGAVTIDHRTSNKKVVTVNEKGVITAVGTGTANIYTKITLYSGKTRIVTSSITVKKAGIVITKSTNSMQLGESFTFKVEVFGYAVGEIVWYTDKKSVLVIDKRTGRATADSLGTDYVIVKVGKVFHKIKVVVIR